MILVELKTSRNEEKNFCFSYFSFIRSSNNIKVNSVSRQSFAYYDVFDDQNSYWKNKTISGNNFKHLSTTV